MSYLKAIIISAAVAFSIIFMVQNIEPLSHPLAIRLNLMFVQFQSTPYATYLIILLTFFVGLFVASLLGISERFRLRRLLKAKDKEIDTLSSELNSLRNLPITSETLSPNGDNGQFKDKALDNDSKKAEEKPMEDIVNNDDRDGDLKPESEEKETLK